MAHWYLVPPITADFSHGSSPSRGSGTSRRSSSSSRRVGSPLGGDHSLSPMIGERKADEDRGAFGDQ